MQRGYSEIQKDLSLKWACANTCLPSDAAIPFLSIFPRGKKTQVQQFVHESSWQLCLL